MMISRKLKSVHLSFKPFYSTIAASGIRQLGASGAVKFNAEREIDDA